MGIIATMKAEADERHGELVAWRESGEYLINCRARGSGNYEWRVIRDHTRGQVISEARAKELLEAMSPHLLAASAEPRTAT